MIPVSFTCEADPRSGGPDVPERFDPVVRMNGEVVWRGTPVDDAPEAEQVALGYLRYAIGGMLLGHGAPPDAPRAADTAAGDASAPPLATSIDQVVDGLRREIADSVQRLQDFIDGGDWKRFLP